MGEHDPSDEARTVLRPKVDPTGDRTPSYVVRVVDGPDSGMELRIDGARPSRALVGQSPACDLRLSDRMVSRRHAALEATRDGLRLTDLGSTNGTLVNLLSIFDACLRGGETIRIGETTLHLSMIAEEGPAAPSDAMRFGRVIGSSPEMRRLYPLCERLSASDVPLVIEGETGTGKELLAEALHEASPRANGPFVVFDCTAVAPSLLESALFGHERGAFTGAVAARKGAFEAANGGTLLIDEIGDLDVALQARLLRAIERSEVQRVGADHFIKFDVRVLAATRRDLDREVQAGRFRDDLFFRLAVARIELPPLRRRRGDVALLGRYFWRRLGGGDSALPPDLLYRFEAYDWPGNVRELHNAVARRLALGDLAGEATLREPIAPDSSEDEHSSPRSGGVVKDPIADVLALDLPFPTSRDRMMNEFERRYVERVLARHGGSVVRAAAASGIARRYFQLIRARSGKQEGQS